MRLSPTLARVAFTPAMETALQDLDSSLMPGPEKSLPPGPYRLADIGRRGWNLLRGDVPLPSLLLNWGTLENNIALMQNYVNGQGVWLAPHGKTTMAPQIWAAQLQAGAWAITVANVGQVEVCRAFGVPRILIANELTSDYDIRYLAQLLHDRPDLEVYALVDSLRGVQRLAEGLGRVPSSTSIHLLIELGLAGGRTGARTYDDLTAVADAVLRASPVLQLAGVEGYEGIVAETVEAGRFLQSLRGAVERILPRIPAGQPCLASAGGSVYFDRVVEILKPLAPQGVQVVLRSGCYVTHDSGRYERESPFGLRARMAGRPTLQPALELWSVVLSRPEPDSVLLGMGKRDMPTDWELPLPLYCARPGKSPIPLEGAYAVVKAYDQHALMHVPPECELAVGDLVACGISHPCTAFDKWRVLLTGDSERNITGAVRTFF